MSERNWLSLFHTLVAVAIGFAIAFGAHLSGKPWWVDWPPLGDATDIGVLTAFGFRWFLSFFEKGHPA